jgi:sugar phosphate isomerase/epimerase
MKLAFSNVAWYPKRIDDFMELIVSLGCRGIELAASMIWDEPVDTTYSQRANLRRKIEGAGLQLTGLQALLFTRPDLMLFGDNVCRRKTVDYLTGLMDICNELGGEALVFGSPRNRNTGGLPAADARRIAIDFFGELGRRAEERRVFFCIEPLGKVETDFINTVADAEELIRLIGSHGLGLHIDAKGLIDEDEVSAPYLTKSFSIAKHVHLNDPGLKAPGSTGFDHRAISRAIAGSGYSRFLSIEMRRVEDEVEGSIKRAIEYVKQIYFRSE